MLESVRDQLKENIYNNRETELILNICLSWQDKKKREKY